MKIQNFKQAIALAFIVVIAGLTGCKKENTEILPTTANLAGVWQVTNYKMNGVSAGSNDFAKNFFNFNSNNTFSVRIGYGDSEKYISGNMTISGRDITISTLADTDETLTVVEISSTTLSLNTSVDSDTYTIVLSRVNHPSIYKVQNKTSTSVITSSYYYDTEIKDFSYHGTIGGNSYSSDKVFTKRSNIRLGISYLGVTFITVYPQTIHTGQENTIILADTTTVFKGTTSMTLSKEFLKSIFLKDKMTLKEAMSKM